MGVSLEDIAFKLGDWINKIILINAHKQYLISWDFKETKKGREGWIHTMLRFLDNSTSGSQTGTYVSSTLIPIIRLLDLNWIKPLTFMVL